MRRSLPVVIVAAASLATLPLALAQVETKLIGSDTEAGDGFGGRVALSDGGTSALVLAHNRLPGYPPDRVGSAYVFDEEGGAWHERAILAPADTDSLLSFGDAITLSGDGNHVIIGGTELVEDLGDLLIGQSLLYTFDRTSEGWVLTDVAEWVAYNDVALTNDGDLALVRATEAILVLERDGAGWVEQARLTPSDSTEPMGFGAALDLSEDEQFLAVGAPTYDGSTSGTGAVYVFERIGDEWVERATLRASDEYVWLQLGMAVEISDGGDVVLASGSYHPDVYVFSRSGDTWVEDGRLHSPDGAPAFGLHLALAPRGDLAVVGAPYEDGAGPDAGAVYTFQREGAGWGEARPLVPLDAAAGNYFGRDVAFSGEGTHLLIGASGDDERGIDAGAAYVYDVPLLLPIEPDPSPSNVLQSYPNPLASATTLRYTLFRPAEVELEALDVLGRRVAVLAGGPIPSGTHEVRWAPGSELPNGVYLLRLRVAGEPTQVQRITLAR